MYRPITRSLVVGLALLLAFGFANAQSISQPFCMSGTSIATATPGHPLGEWEYCITIDWGSLSHALSHWNIILDLSNCICACDEFPFAAADTAGTSDGEGDCIVYYEASFHCDDPSIDGVEGPLVKFDVIDNGCEPDKSGTGTFCFYSDWPPVNISTPNQLGLIKFATLNCTGEITGQLPGCSCGSTSTELDAWGKIKAIFR